MQPNAYLPRGYDMDDAAIWSKDKEELVRLLVSGYHNSSTTGYLITGRVAP